MKFIIENKVKSFSVNNSVVPINLENKTSPKIITAKADSGATKNCFFFDSKIPYLIS